MTLLVLCSICAGLIAGLFGLGGGVVIVPVVFLILQKQAIAPETAMAVAVSTSMASIVMTNIAAALSHHRLGHIEVRAVKAWVLPLCLGACLGSSVIITFTPSFLIIFFGVFLWLVALMAAYRSRLNHQHQNEQTEIVFLSAKQSSFAFFAGCLSAMVGVGGGSLNVPAFQYLGLPVKRAVGTASLLGLLMAFVTVIWTLLFTRIIETNAESVWSSLHIEWLLGPIYLPALAVIVPCTLIFAPVGAMLSHRISNVWLSRLLLCLLVLMGGRMILQGVMA